MPISSDTLNTLPVLSHLDVSSELDVLSNIKKKRPIVFLKVEQHTIERLVQQNLIYTFSQLTEILRYNHNPRLSRVISVVLMCRKTCERQGDTRFEKLNFVRSPWLLTFSIILITLLGLIT